MLGIIYPQVNPTHGEKKPSKPGGVNGRTGKSSSGCTGGAWPSKAAPRPRQPPPPTALPAWPPPKPLPPRRPNPPPAATSNSAPNPLFPGQLNPKTRF